MLPNIEHIDDLANKLKHDNSFVFQEKLSQIILDNSNDKEQRLRNHSLGLLEMKASAAFLRQIDLPEIEQGCYRIEPDIEFYNKNDNCPPYIIKAFKTTEECLGYRIFIKKPQEFLFVGDWGINPERKKELMNQGILFRTKKELKEDLDLKNTVAFAHRFVVSKKTEKEFFKDGFWGNKDKENKEEKILGYKTLLPNKWVQVEGNNGNIENILLDKENFDILQLEEKIWEIWNYQNYGKNFYCSIEIDCPNDKVLPDYQIVLLTIELKPEGKESFYTYTFREMYDKNLRDDATEYIQRKNIKIDTEDRWSSCFVKIEYNDNSFVEKINELISLAVQQKQNEIKVLEKKYDELQKSIESKNSILKNQDSEIEIKWKKINDFNIEISTLFDESTRLKKDILIKKAKLFNNKNL